jgi:hypothetical protein
MAFILPPSCTRLIYKCLFIGGSPSSLSHLSKSKVLTVGVLLMSIILPEAFKSAVHSNPAFPMAAQAASLGIPTWTWCPIHSRICSLVR